MKEERNLKIAELASNTVLDIMSAAKAEKDAVDDRFGEAVQSLIALIDVATKGTVSERLLRRVQCDDAAEEVVGDILEALRVWGFPPTNGQTPAEAVEALALERGWLI